MEARKEGPEISAGPLRGEGMGKKGLTCGPGEQRGTRCVREVTA